MLNLVRPTVEPPCKLETQDACPPTGHSDAAKPPATSLPPKAKEQKELPHPSSFTAEQLEQRREQLVTHTKMLQATALEGAPQSVVIGPMEVWDVSKSGEFLTALLAVRDGALSEGRASEYDVYVTTDEGVACNENSAATTNEAGPYFLREIYPTKEQQDAHGQDSEALAAFRAVKGALADFKDPDRAVDIPRAQAVRRRVPGESQGRLEVPAASSFFCQYFHQ